MPKVFILNTTPNKFSSIKSGKMKFVLIPKSVATTLDAKIKVGDEILLQEEIQATETKPAVNTGQICHRKVTHVLSEVESLENGAIIVSVEPI